MHGQILPACLAWRYTFFGMMLVVFMMLFVLVVFFVLGMGRRCRSGCRSGRRCVLRQNRHRESGNKYSCQEFIQFHRFPLKLVHHKYADIFTVSMPSCRRSCFDIRAELII